MMAEATKTHEENVDEELVAKRKSTSFSREMTRYKPRYSASHAKQLQQPAKKTTNLHSHLQHHHKDLYQALQEEASFKRKTTDIKPSSTKAVQQASIPQSFASVTPYEKA